MEGGGKSITSIFFSLARVLQGEEGYMGSFGGYDLGDSGIVGLLVGLLVVLLAFFFFPRKSAPRKKTVLLLGNVGSGKTTLFFQVTEIALLSPL